MFRWLLACSKAVMYSARCRTGTMAPTYLAVVSMQFMMKRPSSKVAERCNERIDDAHFVSRSRNRRFQGYGIFIAANSL
jgi:hypothetical protein